MMCYRPLSLAVTAEAKLLATMLTTRQATKIPELQMQCYFDKECYFFCLCLFVCLYVSLFVLARMDADWDSCSRSACSGCRRTWIHNTISGMSTHFPHMCTRKCFAKLLQPLNKKKAKNGKYSA